MSVDKTGVREQIMNSALDVFLEYGYKGAGMRKIAQAAGMPLATMQYYYRYKQDIFTGLAASVIRDTNYFLNRLQNPVFRRGRVDSSYLDELAEILFSHVAKNGKKILLTLRKNQGTPFEGRNKELVRQTESAIENILAAIAGKKPDLNNYRRKQITIIARMVIDLVVSVAELSTEEAGRSNSEGEGPHAPQWAYDILQAGIRESYGYLEKLAEGGK